MAKICILSALLLQLLYTSVQGQNSPCLDHFTYIKMPGSDKTIGEIEIRNSSKDNLELHLKVDLKIDSQLPTSYIGEVDLTRSKEDAARDVLEGRPLLYHIYFPVQNPLPTVHRIWFNNDQICSSPEIYITGNVTIITLEHNFKIIIRPAQNQPNSPPQKRPAKQKPNSGGNQFVSSFISGIPEQILPPYPQPAPRRASRQTPSAPIDKIENYNECGISRSHSGGSNRLIAHGNKTLPGQWPWVAAIFRVIYYYEYLCSSTILTTKHVLTAGHCLKLSDRTNETMPAHILSVALGRYKLMNFNEEGSVTMDVASYIFHPEYTHTVSGDSDLAIIILKSPVEFTPFIRPICLLPPSVDSRRLEQTDGIIVGWGEDEYGNRYTEEPRLATMPIVRTDVCLRSDPSFFFITSERTFCAGGPNLTISGACNGDSGSGLVIFDSVTGRYHLRGVVSRTIGNQPFCDQRHYIVFVDVFKYLPWITIIIQPAQHQPDPLPQNRPVQKPPRLSQQVPRPTAPVPVENMCTDRSNKCINIRNCPEILSILHGPKPLSEQTLQFLRNSQCGSEGNNPKVCCNEQTTPPTIPRTTPSIRDTTTEVPEIDLGPPNVTNHPNLRLLDHAMCGPISQRNGSEPLATGSYSTSLFQYPWMALIAYDSGKPNPEFRCGGTVISSRYVLTVAHCVTLLPASSRIIGVRIGDHDISKERDCETDNNGLEVLCAEMYQDFAVESVHSHPGFNSMRLQNDIALIRLNKSVNFEPQNAKPICLPFGTATNLNHTTAVVTGYGAPGRRSQVLLQARLPVVAYEPCKNLFSRISQIWYKQLCAGQFSIDSCVGGSGGPLQASGIYMGRHERMIQYGITSYGMKKCDTQGFPGVYTKVAYYMDWILDTMTD